MIFIGPKKTVWPGEKVAEKPLSKERRKMVPKTKTTMWTEKIDWEEVIRKPRLVDRKWRFFFSEDTKPIKNSDLLDLSSCWYLWDEKIKTSEWFLVDKLWYADIEICLNMKWSGLFHTDVLVLNDDKIISIIPFDGKGICQMYTKQTVFFEKGHVNFRIKTKGERIKVLGIQTGFYSQIWIEFS